MSTPDTYLLINGQETGPFPASHLRQGAVSGWFPADAAFRSAEDTEYRPLSELLTAAPAGSAPPVAAEPVRPIRWRRWFIGATVVGVVVGLFPLAIIISSASGESIVAAVGLGVFALLYLGVFAGCMLGVYVAMVWLMLPWELMRRLDAILDELRRR